jgi:hypothetical protein
MFKYLRGIALAAAMTLNCGAAFGQDNHLSANALMPGCRAFLGSYFFRNGEQCAGLIEGIAYGAAAGAGVCYEPDVTIGQMVSIVVKYIDDRPARQHEYFKALALEALRAAWPCKK